MLAAKARVGPDWPSEVPHLRTYGPSEFVVTDPHHLGAQGMGYPLEQGWLDTWEAESPVARPMLARELAT